MNDRFDSNPTRWTLIVRAKGTGADHRQALSELIKQYEKFVIWLVCRRGHPPDRTPEELKQEFLLGVVRRGDIGNLDPAIGSFRAWLSTAVRRFIGKEWRKWYAERSGRRHTSFATVEQPDESATEEALCAREFYWHIVLQTLARLRAEARDPLRFDSLARFLPGPQMDIVELAPLAHARGMTPNALASAICTLRARFRVVLRQLILDTLDPDPREPPRPTSLPTPSLLVANGVEAPSRDWSEEQRAKAVDAELLELCRHLQ
jgi:DNA-directed RNA polymerase specialized sigma24 family protein